MLFSPTKIPGAFTIDPEPVPDERGYFARSFCVREFKQHGLKSRILQCSISHNHKKGTLRGMHYQIPPHEEEKIVSCISGSVYDVILDLRNDSPMYRKWIAVDLDSRSFRAIYIPAGCAHGFQTLEDNTTVSYQMTGFYHPENARAVRYNDPAFAIEWPVDRITISEKDRIISDYPL